MWHIGVAASCPTDRPYALISGDGTVGGCYSSREAANAGIAAMDVEEDGDGIGHQPSGVTTDLPDGAAGTAIGNQTPWTKNPIMYTTPSSQIW